jgi:hypothetical protein
LFWRIAPLLALTAGSQIAIQTLWAGPWFRDVMGLARDEVARHLLWVAVGFMIGILTIGVIADRMARRGIGPIAVMLSVQAAFFIAQFIIVMQWNEIAFPAWIATAATGQVAILAYPWFAEHVGNELAGRSNAAFNFAIFGVAFAVQYLVGVIIGFFPATPTGYDADAYSWAFGIFLALQLLALGWYFIEPRIRVSDIGYGQSSSR